jgi:intracellular sulfur oxidation DsrE/DsrF family protein
LSNSEPVDEALDRRAMLKAAAGGFVAGGLLAAVSQRPLQAEAAFVPNNFRAVVHITRQEDFTYAFSSLDTIAQHYKKATGRLIIDGTAVMGLSNDDILGQIQSAKDAGAEIIAASDALSINGIDPSALPSYIKTDVQGVIAVVDAQVKGYHYMKL